MKGGGGAGAGGDQDWVGLVSHDGSRRLIWSCKVWMILLSGTALERACEQDLRYD